MEIASLLAETLANTLISIGRLALILVPIIVLIEIARHYRLIEKVTGKVRKPLQYLTLPQEAALPLLGGMFFGIVFGSALIIDSSREGILKKRDLILIGIFLSISHSVVEDTFIFAVFGANPLILLATRITLAVIITRIAASLIDHFAARQAQRL